jgi:hypothetical protein
LRVCNAGTRCQRPQKNRHGAGKRYVSQSTHNFHPNGACTLGTLPKLQTPGRPSSTRYGKSSVPTSEVAMVQHGLGGEQGRGWKVTVAANSGPGSRGHRFGAQNTPLLELRNQEGSSSSACRGQQQRPRQAFDRDSALRYSEHTAWRQLAPHSTRIWIACTSFHREEPSQRIGETLVLGQHDRGHPACRCHG